MAMSETERVNAILRKMGSNHVVLPHSLVNEALLALIEAIPAYVEREVAKATVELK